MESGYSEKMKKKQIQESQEHFRKELLEGEKIKNKNFRAETKV